MIRASNRSHPKYTNYFTVLQVLCIREHLSKSLTITFAFMFGSSSLELSYCAQCYIEPRQSLTKITIIYWNVLWRSQQSLFTFTHCSWLTNQQSTLSSGPQSKCTTFIFCNQTIWCVCLYPTIIGKAVLHGRSQPANQTASSHFELHCNNQECFHCHQFITILENVAIKYISLTWVFVSLDSTNHYTCNFASQQIDNIDLFV